MDKAVASKLIAECLEIAHAKMNEAVALAEDSGVCFTLPWGGDCGDQRGMGAKYVPTTASEQDKKWNCNESWFSDELHAGWQPSAGSC